MLNSKELGYVAVGAALVLVMGYIAYSETDNKSKPRYQTPLAVSSLSLIFDELDAGEHYFHPNYSVPGQTQIFMKCRFPRVSGQNISTLIHQGIGALNRPAPQDGDWINRPPAEVMF